MTDDFPLRQSELYALSKCEQAWWYGYVAEVPSPPSQAMVQGSLYHLAWGHYWLSGGSTPLVEGFVPDLRPEDQPFVNERIVDDVQWMISRYAIWRSTRPAEWRMVDQEGELDVHRGGLWLQGRYDALFEHLPTGGTYLGECKTMKDWRRLDTLEVDPQLTQYWLMLEASGLKIDGVMYDAARTYRWKRDPHPPADSFQELLILRTPEQLQSGLLHLEAVNERRRDIREGAIPIRSISSNNCNGCAFKDRCWEDLAFPQDGVEWEE